MLPHLVSDLAARYLPGLASGAAFHRRALDAAERGRWAAAERWFECAAERYRRDLEVEALARLRVHQLMVRARSRRGAGGQGGADPADMVEIVQRLNRLDRLETLDSPHELADARSVLAEWIEGQATPAPPVAPSTSVTSRAA